ncbi:MAG TPA: N-6 DNA methylase, partial [Chryseolinea sp.]|nr:N-6 DNA methylase [Chryseolinea sp.]
LKPKGRAALVMANSASDARHSEADIRKNLIKGGVIDIMLTLPKNMFYTVTLPATLWFFDKSKTTVKESERKVLFIDARNIFRQIDRAHREFTEEHIQNIATIVRLYRGETRRLKTLLKHYEKQAADFEGKVKVQSKEVSKVSKAKPDDEKEQKRWEKQVEEAEKKLKEVIDRQHYFENHITWLNDRFPKGEYEDVTGLCKAATLSEIEEQEWSLNPGRYVGVVIEEDGLTKEEFFRDMIDRHKMLEGLDSKAMSLTKQIGEHFKSIIND